MGKLIYSATTSLDGYMSDQFGNIDWTSPSEEILAMFNDILQNVGTFLLGRVMYETLKIWDTFSEDSESPGMNQFAKIWAGANKIVYSTSLKKVSGPNTTIAPDFDTKTLAKLITDSDKDFDIGGPHLAGVAIRAGLVDEFHQIIVPKIIGGSNFWLPDKTSLELELVEIKKLQNGSAYLKYLKKS